MEVRIKEGNGYVDADWTIEDGVMVVSPKKFEPKDGDILVGGNRTEDGGNYWIFILKGEIKDDFDGCMSANEYASVEKSGSLEIDNYSDSMKWYCPATEEEKKKLFDKLADEGYSWDAERKEIVKLKWKPKEGEIYFLPRCDVSGFHVRSFDWEDTRVENKYYEKGWIYKTKEESQEFCNRLNDAISQVKP